MHDLRLAFRQLRRRPRAAALAIVTMGLALGASVGIATIVDHALFRPLPYPDSDRLVTIWNTYPTWREREGLSRFWDRIDFSWPEYEAVRAQRSTFTEVAIMSSGDAVLGDPSGSGPPDVVLAGAATHGLLDVLRIAPLLGRWFTAAEDRAGTAPVAVLRHEFWASRYGADDSLIGSTIMLDGASVTVIGVLPRGFRFGRIEDARTPDLWMPLGRIADPANDGNHAFLSVARLQPGVTLERAHAVSAATLRGERSPQARGARVESRTQYERGSTKPMLLLFMGAVAVLLLLACATVATMQLTRAFQRDREIAMRVAIGATRTRLARQLLAENVVLGLAGGGVGVLVAAATVGALLRLMPPGTPGLEYAALDLRLILIATGLALTTGVLFGLAPLLRAVRRDPADALRGSQATTRSGPLLTIVGVQAALAVLLLAGAALLIQTVRALGSVDPGFALAQRLTFTLTLPASRYVPEAASGWFNDFTSRVAALPGVTAVEATSVVPLSGGSVSNSIWPASFGPETGRAKPEAERRIVTPSFFSNMGIELLRGRPFRDADDASAPRVMLVSQSAVDRVWQGRNPVNDRVELDDTWWTVIGVVADVRDQSLRSDPLTTVYVPAAQWPRLSNSFVVRTALPPMEYVPQIRDIVTAMDREVPLRNPRSLDDVVAASTQPERTRAALLSGYALLATLLALGGLYGVTTYMAAQRAREIGIRIALGARVTDVIRTILARTLAAAFGGAMAGVLVALGATQVLRRFLFGVEPADPTILAASTSALIVFALLTAVIPALRSAQIRPTEALRRE